MTRRSALLVSALAVGALAACGGGGSDDAAGAAVTAEGPPDGQTVTVVGNASLKYEPAVVNARPGTLTLTLGNEGGTPHDLAFEDTAFEAIPTVGADQEKSATYTFSSAGAYDFVCTLHPGMDGKVVVS